jgi:hypothetical protein
VRAPKKFLSATEVFTGAEKLLCTGEQVGEYDCALDDKVSVELEVLVLVRMGAGIVVCWLPAGICGVCFK